MSSGPKFIDSRGSDLPLDRDVLLDLVRRVWSNAELIVDPNPVFTPEIRVDPPDEPIFSIYMNPRMVWTDGNPSQQARVAALVRAALPEQGHNTLWMTNDDVSRKRELSCGVGSDEIWAPDSWSEMTEADYEGLDSTT